MGLSFIRCRSTFIRCRYTVLLTDCLIIIIRNNNWGHKNLNYEYNIATKQNVVNLQELSLFANCNISESHEGNNTVLCDAKCESMLTIAKLRRKGVHSYLKIASRRQTAKGRKQAITTGVDAIMSCHCQNRIWINLGLRDITLLSKYTVSTEKSS